MRKEFDKKARDTGKSYEAWAKDHQKNSEKTWEKFKNMNKEQGNNWGPFKKGQTGESFFDNFKKKYDDDDKGKKLMRNLFFGFAALFSLKLLFNMLAGPSH